MTRNGMVTRWSQHGGLLEHSYEAGRALNSLKVRTEI